MTQPPDLTVEEVAAELRLTYDTVLRLLRAGEIPGYKADRKQWRIERAQLDAFKAAGGIRRPGRPRQGEQARKDEQQP